MSVVVATEFLLYLSCALLTGGTVTRLRVKDAARIHFPKWLVPLSAFGIAAMSFFPLLPLIERFAAEEGVWWSVWAVLTQLRIGRAWLWTVVIAWLLIGWVKVSEQRHMDGAWTVTLILAVFLIATIGWASHASGLSGLGFIAHTLHLLAVSVWIGSLIAFSWFPPEQHSWPLFLKWFTPLALIALNVVMAAGLYLNWLIAPDYVNAWSLNYGQALLIKHMLIIPLLSFAVVNGILMRQRLKKDPGYNPQNWMRAESVIALIVFSVTGVMGQQTPPHDVLQTVQFTGPSPLFSIFYGGGNIPDTGLVLHWSALSLLFAVLAVLFLGLIYLIYKRRKSPVTAFLCGLIFAIAAYLALMTLVSQ